MKRKCFTLVELLAVIAIIGILAGILIPALGGAQLRGKITQAKSDMRTIETALEAFAADNGGRYTGNNYQWNNKTQTKVGTKFLRVTDPQNILLELCDPENSGVNCTSNRRKIRYLDPSQNYTGNTADPLWLDPWGGAYTILLCMDGSGKVFPHQKSNGAKSTSGATESNSHTVYSSIALWSKGPDGTDAQGTNADADTCGGNSATADDVASWHK